MNTPKGQSRPKGPMLRLASDSGSTRGTAWWREGVTERGRVGRCVPRRSKLGTSNPGGRPGRYLCSRRLSARVFVIVAVFLVVLSIFGKKTTHRQQSEILKFWIYPAIGFLHFVLLPCDYLRIYPAIWNPPLPL